MLYFTPYTLHYIKTIRNGLGLCRIYSVFQIKATYLYCYLIYDVHRPISVSLKRHWIMF